MKLKWRKKIEAAILLIFLLLFAGILLYLLRGYFFRTAGKIKKRADGKIIVKSNIKKPCILCGSLLGRGENLKSDEYKGEEKSIVHVFGCPYCYGKNAVRERICPICKKALPRDGYLMGRMWDEKGKRRLHIVSCTQCARRHSG